MNALLAAAVVADDEGGRIGRHLRHATARLELECCHPGDRDDRICRLPGEKTEAAAAARAARLFVPIAIFLWPITSSEKNPTC
jgi:hypothetical protein